MRYLAAVLIVFLAISVFAQTEDKIDSIALPDVAKELIAMRIEDQRYRGNNDPVFETTPWTDSLEQWVWQRQSEIDAANVIRLEELIETHGWLGVDKVGQDAAVTVFLIIQHAELTIQEKYLPLMRESVIAGEFPPSDLAYLEDRIRMYKGEPQLYGTQLIINQETGETELYSIEDEANVDQRRAAVGLGPLAEYCELFGIEYKIPVDTQSTTR